MEDAADKLTEGTDESAEQEEGVSFKVGRFYQHESGGKLAILGVLPDLEGGEYMIGRTMAGEVFKITEFHTTEKKYKEITPQEFYSGIQEVDELPED